VAAAGVYRKVSEEEGQRLMREEGGQVVSNTWVVQDEDVARGKVRKARAVARGFEVGDMEGEEVNSLTVSAQAVTVLIALAAWLGRSLEIRDVEKAFLNVPRTVGGRPVLMRPIRMPKGESFDAWSEKERGFGF